MSEEATGAPRAKLGSPLRCPWCHQPARARALRVRCADCGVGLHVGCAAEAKACPTLGCGESLSAPEPRRRHPQPSRLGGALIASAATLALAGGLWRLIDAPLHVSPPPLALEQTAKPAPLPLLRRALQPERRASGTASRLATVERPGERNLEGWRKDELARGLSWLTASQFEDGTWSSDAHSIKGTTALAVAAFAASGSTHRSGPHQVRVHKALTFLREKQNSGVWVSRPEDWPLLVLALSLLYEATDDADLAPRLRRALQSLDSTSPRGVHGFAHDPVWTEVARSAAAAALGDAAFDPEKTRRYHPSLQPDLVDLLERPKHWVASSWFVRPNSHARSAWRASLVVHLHHLQHPAGAWTGGGGTDQLNLSWSTARNVLALRLLGE